MNADKTLIVILHFGSIYDTLECLDSLRRWVQRPFDIFLVNNGPDKNVEATLKAKHPDIFYHQGNRDLGFAAANNIGLRFSLEHGYRYSLLLNNDTVAIEDFLQPLIELMDQDPSIAMTGPAIYLYDQRDQLWSCGGRIYWMSGRIGGLAESEQLGSDPQDVDYLPGACILVRNEVLGKIGLMSEEYFLGVEEADWSVRVRGAGFRLMATPKSVLLHKVGVSSRFTPELVYNGLRNRFLFLRRHLPVPLNSLLNWCILLNELRKHWPNRRICWRAFKDHGKYRTIRRSHLDAVQIELQTEPEITAW